MWLPKELDFSLEIFDFSDVKTQTFVLFFHDHHKLLMSIFIDIVFPEFFTLVSTEDKKQNEKKHFPLLDAFVC